MSDPAYNPIRHAGLVAVDHEGNPTPAALDAMKRARAACEAGTPIPHWQACLVVALAESIIARSSEVAP